MDCEICGKNESGYLILVEGAKLNVCKECSGSGKILRMPAPPKPQSQPASIYKQELEPVEGYGKLIYEARKKLGLPLQVLAERINEKESFLERIEHEKAFPNEKLARKLEKELGIKLLQVVGTESTAVTQNKIGQITLGDIIEIERKEKKK